MKTKFALLLAFLPALLLCPFQVKGQTEVDLMSISRSLPLVTRAQLEESLAWHQAVIDSTGVKESERKKALEALEYIEVRLAEGDFRPGDQIVFYVEGEELFPLR